MQLFAPILGLLSYPHPNLALALLPSNFDQNSLKSLSPGRSLVSSLSLPLHARAPCAPPIPHPFPAAIPHRARAAHSILARSHLIPTLDHLPIGLLSQLHNDAITIKPTLGSQLNREIDHQGCLSDTAPSTPISSIRIGVRKRGRSIAPPPSIERSSPSILGQWLRLAIANPSCQKHHQECHPATPPRKVTASLQKGPTSGYQTGSHPTKHCPTKHCPTWQYPTWPYPTWPYPTKHCPTWQYPT